MGVDRLADKPAAFDKRQHVHAHNACFGSTRFTMTVMANMEMRRSLTPRARALAGQIYTLARELYQELKTRVDP